MHVHIKCKERTCCMFCTYQERTSNQEWTHSMSAVCFGFCLSLIILENNGIKPKIMGQPEFALGIEIISQILHT